MPLDKKGDLVLDYATEADAYGCGKTFFEAFHDHPYFRRMMPDTSQARDVWSNATRFVVNDANTIVLKVTDQKTGQIISHGRWVKPKKKEAEQQPGHEAERWSDAFMTFCDEETATALFGAFERNRGEMMGDRPHYCKTPAFEL